MNPPLLPLIRVVGVFTDYVSLIGPVRTSSGVSSDRTGCCGTLRLGSLIVVKHKLIDLFFLSEETHMHR